MGASDNAPRKNAPKTRGRPFEPGNAGRPKGARNKATLMVERMIEGEAEAVASVAVALAKAGDTTMIKAVLDRIAPARKEPTVTIDLPPIQSPADAPLVAARLIEAVAAGEIAPGEAQGLAALLEAFRKQTELASFEERLAALEAAHGKQ
jgi:hypothetical protein